MKQLLAISALILLASFAWGQQNLVPNHSFEDTEDCPTSPGFWEILDWSNGNGLSPDNYNSCALDTVSFSVSVPTNYVGFQEAYNGEGYVGITCFLLNYPDLREYVQAILTDTLTGGLRYHIGFYCNAANRLQYAVSTLGAAITIEAPDRVTQDYPNTLLDAESQVLHEGRFPLTDTANWVLISDTVLAMGGERYITIGNFYPDSESDTVRFNPDQPPIGTSPTTSAYYYIDDVFVYAIDSVPSGVGINEVARESEFSLYPNPSNGQFTLAYQLNEMETGEIRMFDMVGKQVFAQTVSGEAKMVNMNLSELSTGLYLISLEVNGEVRFAERLSILK